MNYLLSMRGLVLVLALCLVASITPAVHAQDKGAGALTDKDVEEAIEKIKKFLYEGQDASGAWFGKYHTDAKAGLPDKDGNVDKNAWGPTAMATLALIVSGESPQNPKIAKALKVLGEVQIGGVYALSMRTHVWSYLPQSVYGGALAKDADIMRRSSYGLSKFNYPVVKEDQSQMTGNRTDNSTTQYGILALWQASKRGVKIPQSFWEDAVKNFLNMQGNDGGWSYGGNGNTTQSMTLAGLTCMYVAQQELFRDKSKPNPQVEESINKGLKYLNDNFNPNSGVHGGVSYMWYGYERVGLASGIKHFGGKDWFQVIAKKIVDQNARYGTSYHTAAFDLMFLARGRVPVWINKLAFPKPAWNNRPNDVYFLNRYISEYREHEVNWQVVSINTKPEEWISAPLMWISSDSALEFDEGQINKLKKYIDLGGTIIFNPEKKSSSFRASVRDMAEKMYPNLKFQAMDRKHPMATLLEGDAAGSRAPEADIITNGARVKMILLKDDWGMTFQADKTPDPDDRKTPEWRHITNIYGVVTDRGELTPRLSTPIVKRKQRESTGTIKVVLPKWEDPNGALPENDVYVMMRNYMFNETGKELDVQTLPLSELAGADATFLHLVGTKGVKMTAAEIQAIQTYLSEGGTVLVEQLGGTGDFTAKAVDQLGGIFSTIGDNGLVETGESILSGRGLAAGKKRNRKVVYRRMTLERAIPSTDSRLFGYMTRGEDKPERIPVLISYEDLSLGMLGVRQYGINGYSVQSARDLMVNILLEADKAKNGGYKKK